MHIHRLARTCLRVLFTVCLLTVAGSASASAAPAWRVDSVTNTTAMPGSTITYHVDFVNVGTTTANGTKTLTMTLPAGLTGVAAVGENASSGGVATCTVAASVIQCSITDPVVPNAAAWVLRIDVAVDDDVVVPSLLTSSITIVGGGATASTVDPTRIDDAPGFGIEAFDGQVAADAAGVALTQAGGHPYAATTSFDINTLTNPLPLAGDVWPAEAIKDAVADLPPGFVGSTAGVDQCTASQLANTAFHTARPLCASTSQVGTVLLRLNGRSNLLTAPFANALGPFPVFNMVPPPGAPAAFGFNAFGTTVTLTARLRSNGDYGLSVDSNDISEGLAVAGTTFTFWGVPSDPSHDRERACPDRRSPWDAGPSCPSGAPPRAFLRNPTSCTPPAGSPVQDGLATNLSIDSWAHPGVRDGNGAPAAGDPRWQTATWVSHNTPGYPHPPSDFGPHLLPTGCDKVPFTPSFDFRPAIPSVRANSPTPFQVDLSLPQSDDPTSIGESDLKKVQVTLPEGVRVSPSSADGLNACTPQQIGLHSTADPTCPDASKIGSMTITTPLIDQQFTGSVYLAAPHDNPFNSLLAIYLVAKGAGVTVKLAGQVTADPVTGQLTTTVDNNPQLPFSNFHLEFKGGPRAALLTPPRCGTYTTHAVLTPWARPDTTVSSDSSFTVDTNSDGSPCAPAGFTPGFRAGTQSPVAGASTSFALQLTRGDDDQEFGSLKVDMPTGALAKIANVTPCPDGAANAGLCQELSRIGSVTVGAGSGTNPFYIQTGRAYLTGPYKGAPFGLSIVVPAVAGPFDLGNVVVRSALDVDRHSAQARVTSDPLPTILQGIPLGVRDIRVVIDKRDFFVNPTSCASKNVLGRVTSTQGAVAHVKTHFQMTNCAALRLAPKISFTVGAPRHTRAGVSTPLTTTLTMPRGHNTNLRVVSVALPGTLNALLPVVNRACKLAEFNAGHCGDQAKIGTVSVVTPLLRDPLRGGAYFVKTPARVLPDLMFALRGQVALDIAGKIKIPAGKRLATRFDTIPDAPITKLTLHIVSGKNGPIGIATNLCSRKGRTTPATVAYRGQNGALLKVNQRLHIRGCARARKR